MPSPVLAIPRACMPETRNCLTVPLGDITQRVVERGRPEVAVRPVAISCAVPIAGAGKTVPFVGSAGETRTTSAACVSHGCRPRPAAIPTGDLESRVVVLGDGAVGGDPRQLVRRPVRRDPDAAVRSGGQRPGRLEEL